jgi:hypothetical protein
MRRSGKSRDGKSIVEEEKVGSKKLKKVQFDSKLYRAAAENFKLGDSLEANK